MNEYTLPQTKMLVGNYGFLVAYASQRSFQCQPRRHEDRSTTFEIDLILDHDYQLSKNQFSRKTL